MSQHLKSEGGPEGKVAVGTTGLGELGQSRCMEACWSPASACSSGMTLVIAFLSWAHLPLTWLQ